MREETERPADETARDLVGWLRTRDDETLRALLRDRPDLITPVPADLATLASRASTPGAVARVLDTLDTFTLTVVEMLLVLPAPVTYDELAHGLSTAENPGGRAHGAPEIAGPGAHPGDPDPARRPYGATDGAGSGERTAARGEPPRGAEDGGDSGGQTRGAEGARSGERASGAAGAGSGERAGGAGSGGTSDAELEERLRGAVDRLRELLLVWGDDEAMWPVPALGDVITYPMGLGPAAVEAFAGYAEERLGELAADLGLPEAGAGALEMAQGIARMLADPDRLARVLDDAGPEAREALERLAWGPPVGSVSGAGRAVRVGTASSPIERLLARGLLAASGDRNVVLPREVALYLRGGRLTREPVPAPPRPDGRAHALDLVDRMAAGEAFTLVRGVEELLEFWSVAAPGVLRSGGLGVRDLRRAAEELDEPEWVAALYAELAHAAGLLAVSETVDGEWLPTVAYDLWRGRELPDRWAGLARTWLATTRVPGLVGERDDRDRAYNALGDGLDRGGAPETRHRVLRALADAPPGTAAGPDEVRALLDWWQPRRRGRFRDLMVDTVLREAERLGLTGRGALAGYARALLDGAAEPEVRDALAEVLPEPVDHVLLQADLTAVAPGPLTQDLARELALAADVESTGGATVYRFSETSVRRALDAGRSAEELTAFLERHSRTPVPQPLRYLIADVARRHGRIRVGTASAYVRCDDPATLDELLASRHAAPLRLHRIAPTVLVSRTSRAALLDTIRAAGYAPMGESFDGDLVITRPDARRAPERPRSRPASGGRRAPDDDVLTAAVRAIRAGDEAATALRRPITAPGDEPPRSAAATIAALTQAVQAGRRVWIGYLDAQGQASSRIVEPARVEGGYLTAYDATRAAVHRFSLHRITGVAAIDDAGVAAET